MASRALQSLIPARLSVLALVRVPFPRILHAARVATARAWSRMPRSCAACLTRLLLALFSASTTRRGRRPRSGRILSLPRAAWHC
eukprot:3545427-Alexandrium_andersonii.AAC.1